MFYYGAQLQPPSRRRTIWLHLTVQDLYLAFLCFISVQQLFLHRNQLKCLKIHKPTLNAHMNTFSNPAYAQDFCPSERHYFLNHSVGRPLRAAQTSLDTHFFAPWRDGTDAIWQHWLNALQGFNHALADLLNGDVADFCPQSNPSSAWTKVLYSLPKRAGATILLSEHDFPSMGFVAHLAQTQGYKVKFIPAAADHHDLAVWADALTPDVQWVLLTHVQSNTGVQLPVAQIIDIARANQTLTLIDVAQSVGVLPIDVTAWNAHFVAGSCVKWLCGGPGAGFLWVHPDMIEQCQPLDVGWFSHENPFEFDIHHFAYHPRALRFWGGTPSVLPYALASSSIRYLQAVGIEHVRHHNLAMTEQIIAAIDPAHLVSPRAPAQRSGTAVIQMGTQQIRLLEHLRNAQIDFDERDTGVRLSPHIYTTADDMSALITALQKASQ